MKYRIKRDTEVVVISGEHKGKRGKVLKVLRDSQKVIVEGVNLRKKCVKKTQENPKGSIVEREMPIHYSNVMAVVSAENAGVAQGKGGQNE